MELWDTHPSGDERAEMVWGLERSSRCQARFWQVECMRWLSWHCHSLPAASSLTYGLWSMQAHLYSSHVPNVLMFLHPGGGHRESCLCKARVAWMPVWSDARPVGLGGAHAGCACPSLLARSRRGVCGL